MTRDRIRVGIIGAGVFGRNHLRVVSQSEGARLAAIYDTDRARCEAAALEFGGVACNSLDQLLELSDAAIVASPTTTHCDLTCKLLDGGLHVLVEKPIAATVEEGSRMVEAARRAGRILQTGHLERFNPAVVALSAAVTCPLFFEIHRLSVFTPRSLDVDVVADLMIHDLDIVLSLTRTMPEEVRAAGICILSPKVDIANVRLAFPGGVIANLTASRVSTERVRKLRLFQPGQYISVDYARQDCVAIEVDPATRAVRVDPKLVEKAEPLVLQFASFLECLTTGATPRVDGEAGLRALQAARLIVDKIEEHASVVAGTLARRT